MLTYKLFQGFGCLGNERVPTVKRLLVIGTLCLAWSSLALGQVFAADADGKALPSIDQRFASTDGGEPAIKEVPNFQKHVSPLMGRLGCNGRACHGSFQGRGDFRLSLFGYDFEADYKALKEADRIAPSKPLESQILTKPVDADMHEGGKRFAVGGWEYWVLRRWIEAGAPYEKSKLEKLARLEVQPAEMTFRKPGELKQLKVIAHWENGTAEDVTCLCRFQTNDPSVATIDEKGLVTAGDIGDSHVVVSYDNAVVPVAVLRPYSELTEATYPSVAYKTQIDQLVGAKLRKIGVVPSEVCTDEEFLRRVSLDLTGTLPTVAEVKAFQQDKSENKRKQKIDELLGRPGYAAQWATFFCDLTGNNDDQLRNFLPVQKNEMASNQWYEWIRDRLARNVPYDDMVEGIVTAKSRNPEESYAEYCEAMSDICQDTSGKKYADRPGLVHYWVRTNFRTPEEKAIGFAYSFLGVRIQCAQCHKHPFDQWTKEDFANFERLFNGIQGAQNSLASDAKKVFDTMVSELGVDTKLKGNQLRKELAIKLEKGNTIPFPELLVNSRSGVKKDKDKSKDKNKKSESTADARLLGGDWVSMNQEDIRGKLMEWLRSPENPYFARAIVNRVWAQYFSIGIVSPSDDLNLANAPSNEPLLNYLAKSFIEHDFDLHWLHREILNSDTYQRSWIVNETNRLDKRNFSHSLLRRLPAEAAHDAVLMALADDRRAEEIVAAGRSRALTATGASAVVRGGDTSYALSVFGRSVRETNCDCDRTNEPSLLQTVFLANDAAVQNWAHDSSQSWVASIAKQYGWPMKSKSSSGSDDKDMLARFMKARSSYEKQIDSLDNQIDRAKQREDQNTVKDLKRRRESAEQQFAKLVRKYEEQTGMPAPTRKNEDDTKDLATATATATATQSSANGSGMPAELAREITEQAYLRSLSRLPNADEMNVAVNFLCSETDRAAAVESLIWGIVNTKEFILNH